MFECFSNFEKAYHPLGISKLHLNRKQRSSNCQRRAPFLRRVMKALREGGIFLRNLVSSVRYLRLISAYVLMSSGTILANCWWSEKLLVETKC